MGKKRKGHRDAREAGTDTTGQRYRDISAMWEAELPERQDAVPPSRPSEMTWYRKAKAYWESQPPNLDGMLGGLAHVHPTDVAGSLRFLIENEALAPFVDRAGVALDVGAGIGRVSKALLCPLFDKVDLLEADATFIAESRQFAADCANLERRICCPMEDFEPEPGRYSLVWIQWCIIYLSDADLVRFLRRFADAGARLICIKDNVTQRGFVVDKEDSSVTRSDAHMKRLFAEARLSVVAELVQDNFPEELFAVKMYALRDSH